MPKLNLGNFTNLYRTGWYFLFFSFLLYLLPEFLSFPKEDSIFLLFVGNFLLTIVYYLSLVIIKFRQERPRPSIPFACWVHVVLLYTISAFSLNRSLTVFAPFPLWLNIYTLLGASLFLSFPYYQFFNHKLKTFISFCTGAELILSLYFVLFLLPLMPLSLLGFWLFGLSIHTFVPFFWLIFVFQLISWQEKKYWKPLAAGILLPLIILTFYLYQWKNIQVQVKDIQAENHLNTKNQIPVQVALAQWLPSDKLTEELLISPFYSQRFWGNSWGLEFENSPKYHNPLAIIGNLFFGEISLDQESTQSLMNIRRDQRHRTEERLWTGISLNTSAITSRIQVFPKYRLAYHEKTLTVHYADVKQSRDVWFIRPTQQAFYTFHLPEGSIVTSLSLWIDGKEQVSRLSTRKKADSAFRQIVGVERRDPALVHWKEGNLVTVSVFPCTPKEDRVFKIGFTTPLKTVGKEMVLENIWFEGPDGKNARELTELIFDADAHFSKLPQGFETEDGKIIRKGDYQPYWTMNLQTVAPDTHAFVFNHQSFSMREAFDQAHATTISKVYFELNENWKEETFLDLLKSMGDKECFVWSAQMEKINENNASHLFKKYKQCAFSLPYFQLLKKPENSLIIACSGHRSPLLSEMKESAFSDQLGAYFRKQSKPVLFVNISDELSPIYKTLQELRLIQYLPMDAGALKNALMKQSFNWAEENENTIVLPESHLYLCKSTSAVSEKSGQAPDHLMRLFAYNDIVRKVGKDFFNSEQYENALFREAEEAYVLSPVTSLIVLESEADYKRMGIDKNVNTLGNAGIMEGGSVPEPHEWALISFVLVLLLWFKIKDQPLSALSNKSKAS